MSEIIRQTGQNEYKNVRELPDHPFDIGVLYHFLRGYNAPRDKIHRMLSQGMLIQLKRGLFVKAPAYGGHIRLFEIANLLYGPSHVSFETALGYYGLIPERIDTIISATSKRKAQFQTPVGRFEYRYLNQTRYAIGFAWQHEPGGAFLIATPEKALADVIAGVPGIGISAMGQFLEEDLRIDMEEMYRLDPVQMEAVADAYSNWSVRTLTRWMVKNRRKTQ